ncbi:MAG: InlB B-repeat-containing protein, partial [Bacteroidales bacterium]|nr:InlB B-repeat-containing protein [Bacteroidales bacterium]
PTQSTGRGLPGNITILPPGVTHLGWIIDGVFYPTGSQYTITKDTDAYAVYNTTLTRTISFEAGTNGTGTMADASVYVGASYTLPDCGFTPEDDYTFAGWEVTDGQIAETPTSGLQPGAVITPSGDITLTAQWEQAAPTPVLSAM